jgi:hypothetical protein
MHFLFNRFQRVLSAKRQILEISVFFPNLSFILHSLLNIPTEVLIKEY